MNKIFNMELVCKVSLNELNLNSDEVRFDYDDELDDGRSVIMEICDTVFRDTGQVDFHVSGFGQDDWRTDMIALATVIEQLPEVIQKIKKDDYNFIIDFYEQGTEKTVVFEEEGLMVKVTCESRTGTIGWEPNPKEIKMEKEQIKSMIMNLYNKFFLIGETLCPTLINHP